MFEYGVMVYGMPLDDFYAGFLSSELCERFEMGDSSVIAGMSGTEMARSIICGDKEVDLPSPHFDTDRSRAYWLGWSLAYYQWSKNISFKKITENVTINEIIEMYPKYHEMDIRQFADGLDEMRMQAAKESSHKRLRRLAGYSQREVSEITGIPLRSLQAYEQRQKNINNAGADYVCRLAKTLNCDIEMLMEM